MRTEFCFHFNIYCSLMKLSVQNLSEVINHGDQEMATGGDQDNEREQKDRREYIVLPPPLNLYFSGCLCLSLSHCLVRACTHTHTHTHTHTQVYILCKLTGLFRYLCVTCCLTVNIYVFQISWSQGKQTRLLLTSVNRLVTSIGSLRPMSASSVCKLFTSPGPVIMWSSN